MLTNFLPNGGNGAFTIHAVATDREGHSVTLGSKSITCDNAHATLPFGTIDTPEQGGTITGSSYVNFGWALTPQLASIPTNGSTIWVWVDGAPAGHPTYNQYRPDIATLFPGYANSNGAVGFFYLNPSTLAEGAHSIAWSVEDSLGRLDGIGSRYFSVSHDESFSLQGTPQTGVDAVQTKPPPQGSVSYDASTDFQGISQTGVDAVQTKPPPQGAVEHGAGGVGAGLKPAPTLGLADDVGGAGAKNLSPLPNEPAITEIVDAALPLRVRRGFAGVEETIYPDRDGMIVVTAKMGQPLEIELDPDRCGSFSGLERVGADIRTLPAGSRLDAQTGVFTWLPGPGFRGEFTLEFIANRGNSTTLRHPVKVRIE
jgi:hypothetical protein